MNWTFQEDPFELFISPMTPHSFQQLKQFDDADEDVFKMHKSDYIV